MRDELKLQRLQEIREKVLNLRLYPEIIGDENTEDYPETKLEKAYCELLWQIDEAMRAESKK